jgi:BirA family biotin operon repressor/biotin-[acetyl-CoA-carboxylase] ligase
MSLLKSTLSLLADGKFHSDKEISKFLGISCQMVPEAIKHLLDPSINLENVNHQNYRIVGGLELLDSSYIVNELGSFNRLLSQLEVLTTVDSTNNYLLKKIEYPDNYAVFAEQQTAGRGQFNRTWVSNLGKNIYLSLLWHLSNPINQLAGLTIVIGIAVVKALEAYGLKNIQLKWPNDIIYKGKKLGGILLESRSVHGKIQKTVIGIGLNLYNPVIPEQVIDETITSIYSLQNFPPHRNRLAALILKSLLQTLTEFEAKGLAYFMMDWQRLDCLAGKLIKILNKSNFIEGIGSGINAQGQLGVHIKNKIHYFTSGEIRIQLRSDD